LAVGALNTLFGYSLYALLLWIGLPLEYALLLCSVIGVLFNFVTYGKLAFGRKPTRQSLPRFIAAYVVFYFLNLYLARALIGLGFTAYVALLFLLQISYVIAHLKMASQPFPALPATVPDDVRSIGFLLFSQYTLPFQLIGILVLVATIGVVVLSRKETRG
jgi:putative flippase GtrA